MAAWRNLEPSAENVSAVATQEMVDISLSALRMRRATLTWVCLERRNEMPAALEEIVEAEEEGITMHPGHGPKRILGKGSAKVTALETRKTKLACLDQNKRFNPAFYENSETQIECDTIIMAIGQAPRSGFLHARRQGGTLAARPDRRQPTDSDDLGIGHFRRRRLCIWTAPDHRAASATESGRQWASTNICEVGSIRNR